MLKQLIDAICFRLINGPLGGPADTFNVAKMDIRDGDYLVIRVKSRMTREAAERMRADLKSRLPKGVTALVIDSDADLAVLRPGTTPAGVFPKAVA